MWFSANAHTQFRVAQGYTVAVRREVSGDPQPLPSQLMSSWTALLPAVSRVPPATTCSCRTSSHEPHNFATIPR